MKQQPRMAKRNKRRSFRQELARLGWSEDGNVQFDERWSTGNMDLVRADAANLVALNPGVIVILGHRVIPILTKLTRSIPIVVALSSDPIACRTNVSQALERLRKVARERRKERFTALFRHISIDLLEE